ncbi:hypothetical protein ACJZ2D_008777 [Fusarium nematophilum]
MLSLRYHLLFWALSLLTVPLSLLQKHLTYPEEILPIFLDEPGLAVLGLTIYFLLRIRRSACMPQASSEDKPRELGQHNLIAQKPTTDDAEPQNGDARGSKPQGLELDDKPQGNGPRDQNGHTKLNGKMSGISIVPEEFSQHAPETEPVASKSNGTASPQEPKSKRQNKKKGKKSRNNRPKDSTNENGIAKHSQTNGNTRDSQPDQRPQEPNPGSLRRLPAGAGRRAERPRGFFARKAYPLAEQLGRTIQMYHQVFYFASMPLMCTHVVYLLGLDRRPGDPLQMVVQVLASFIVLGTLEPIRQNRWDIEPCGLEMLRYCCPACSEGVSSVGSTILGLLGLAGITMAIEGGLYLLLGYWVDLPSMWFSEDLTLPQMFLSVWLLSPLIDLVETAIYAVGRVARPRWYKDRLKCVQKPM